jgi:formiminotetrahydrofolate cyclodeaminase
MSGKMAVGGLRAGVELFIEQLAAPTATPGGGSAAAASGAMAAALAHMVASMSRGKKAYVQHESRLSEAIARLTQLCEELKAAIDGDAGEGIGGWRQGFRRCAPTGEPCSFRRG